MATPHHSRRGSTAYYPRKRAASPTGRIRSWPEIEGNPKVQGFAGYKVGMTHVEMVDYRKSSVTAGQSIMSAVTVIEVPPLRVLAIRFYSDSINGLYVAGEEWAENLDSDLTKRINDRKKVTKTLDEARVSEIDDVRLVVATNPSVLTGVPSKKPDLFELRVGGGGIPDRIKLAREKLGKEIHFSDFSKEGQFVDVIGVTKGKGFTGHVERFGVKLLPRKNRKHRRMIGTLGPWHPDWVRNTVPQAGQMGYQQRTAHNIRVLLVSGKENVSMVNPKGGFTGYGLVRSDFVLLHGSIPGPSKRLVKFRDSSRQQVQSTEKITLTYVSIESKQGD